MTKTGISLVLVAFVFLLFGCDPCLNTEIKRITSPDGKKDFVLFERNCGATTDFSLQGSIVKKGKTLPNSSGNAIIMGSENYYPDTITTVYPVWKNNNEISISCKNQPEVFSLKKAMGVNIVMESKLVKSQTITTDLQTDSTYTNLTPENRTVPAFSNNENYTGDPALETGNYSYSSRIYFEEITQLETIRFELGKKSIRGVGKGEADMDLAFSYGFDGIFIDSNECKMNMKYYPDNNKTNVQYGKEIWLLSEDSLIRYNEYEKIGSYVRVAN